MKRSKDSDEHPDGSGTVRDGSTLASFFFNCIVFNCNTMYLMIPDSSG